MSPGVYTSRSKFGQLQSDAALLLVIAVIHLFLLLINHTFLGDIYSSSIACCYFHTHLSSLGSSVFPPTQRQKWGSKVVREEYIKDRNTSGTLDENQITLNIETNFPLILPQRTEMSRSKSQALARGIKENISSGCASADINQLKFIFCHLYHRSPTFIGWSVKIMSRTEGRSVTLFSRTGL